jgi:uncharacterized peroxidase-related enzyme
MANILRARPSERAKENNMSRIQAVDPTQTPAKVQELLGGVHKTLGVTPNLYRVTAQSPAALEGMLGLAGALARGRLGARIRESVALAVAEVDRCDYCLSAHAALGKGAGLNDDEIASARQARAADPRTAAALRFAQLVTEKRGRIDESDLAELRRAGMADGDILEIVAHVALNVFTNYVNLVADTEIDFPVLRHHPR